MPKVKGYPLVFAHSKLTFIELKLMNDNSGYGS